jgi:hypothetical protein
MNDVCGLGTPPMVTEESCDHYRARTFNLYTHRWTCYYDSSGATLVARYYEDDIADFCSGTSSEMVAGDIPMAGSCRPSVVLEKPCGATDGASS